MIKITHTVLVFALAMLPAWSNVSLAAEVWQGPDQVMAAARTGNADAQLEMGILYEYGFFMSENKAPALAWYSLAAEQGNVRAAKLRDKLQASMSPAEIQQAEELKPTLSTAPAPQPAPQPAPEAEVPEAPAVESPQVSDIPTITQ